MAAPLQIECHGKNYTHRMPPMQPLGSAIPSVLQQAGLAATVKPEECQLLLKGKPLDATLAYRFANLPTGAKITLKTGHERVLGFQESSAAPAAQAAPPPAPSSAAAVNQNVPSTSKTITNEKPAQIPTASTADPSPAAVPPAPEQAQPQQQQAPSPSESPAENSSGANTFAGKAIHVFSREAEVQEEAARASPAATELDDAAYEVTEADLRKQLSAYAKNHRAQEGKYLMTKQMREAEQAKKAASYGPVPVRVEFPDVDKTVLQASFPAVAPVAELHELIKTVLLPESAGNFYLFTTPPKTELKDMSISFYAAGLVPAARVHVGFKGGVVGKEQSSCLRPEAAALMGRPPSRAEALGVDEKKKAEVAAEDAAGPSTSRAATAGAAAGGKEQGEAKRAKPGGVPSWMKLSNK